MLTYKNEPQSYGGKPPGLSTRLFLRVGQQPYDTFCHLIYPASAPWREHSQTALILFDRDGKEVATQGVRIPCSGSYSLAGERSLQCDRAWGCRRGRYVIVRDTSLPPVRLSWSCARRSRLQPRSHVRLLARPRRMAPPQSAPSEDDVPPFPNNDRPADHTAPRRRRRRARNDRRGGCPCGGGHRALVMSAGGAMVEALVRSGAEHFTSRHRQQEPFERVAESPSPGRIHQVARRQHRPRAQPHAGVERLFRHPSSSRALRNHVSRRLQGGESGQEALQRRDGARRSRHRHLAFHRRAHRHAISRCPGADRDHSARHRFLGVRSGGGERRAQGAIQSRPRDRAGSAADHPAGTPVPHQGP